MPEQELNNPSVERSRRNPWVIVALVVLAAYVVFRLPLFRGNPERVSAVGQPLAVLELRGLTGTDEQLTANDLQGHVTLINFWATWCGPCRMEFPHLLDLADRFRQNSDFRLLSVSSGQRGEENREELREATAAFLKKLGAEIPTYADLSQKTQQGLWELIRPQEPSNDPPSQVYPLPMTVLVDRRGIIRGVWLGYSPDAPKQMEQMIIRLLGEKQAGRRIQ